MEIRLGTTTKQLDVDAVRDGIEKECPFRRGMYVTVLPAASYNPRFRDLVRQENERVMARMRDGKDPETTDRYDDAAFIVGALVAGMRGLYGADGKEVAYTPEIGEQVIEDPANADVKEWVVLQAQRYGQYYREDVEKDAGNSGSGSSGKRAGAAKSKKTKS